MMKNAIGCFLRDESGLSVTEYAIMLALITLAAVGSISALGGSMNGVFQSIGNLVGQ